MKRKVVLIVFGFVSSLLTLALPLLAPAQVTPLASGYQVSRRGPHDRVWEKVTWDTDSFGVARPSTNSFVEVGTSMHYYENGEWNESQDLIELTEDGSAAAVHAPCKAYFPANLNGPDGITYVTSSNRVFKTRPLGLFYFDSSTGKAVRLASVQDCNGELLPPNQVIWKSVLGPSLLADLRVTFTKSAIESDLILLQKPRPPQAFGMDPATTKIELWHEWIGVPTPRQVTSELSGPDLVDNLLDFGDLVFPAGGRAFLSGNQPDRTADEPAQVNLPAILDREGIPVGKEWLEFDESRVLIERIRWRDIEPALESLPQALQEAEVTTPRDRLACLRELPATRSPQENSEAITLAAASYRPSGLTWDYSIVSGGGNYSFSSNTTYWVTSFCYFTGTVSFDGMAVIKYKSGGPSMVLQGTIMCYGTVSNPTVFTSENENIPAGYGSGGVGETLPGSTGDPTYYDRAFLLYYMPNSATVNRVKIRWAKMGIHVLDFACGSITHTITNSSFEWCQTAVYGDNCAWIAQNSVTCSVGKYYDGPGCCRNSSQSFTVLCPTNVVVSVARVNNPWVDTNNVAEDPNKNSQSECSFVVIDTNTVVAAFFDTHLSQYGLGAVPFSFVPRSTSWAVSTNGGQSFLTHTPLPPTSAVGTNGDVGDPVMAYDRSLDKLYVLVNPSRQATNWGGFRLWTSTNRGATFQHVNSNVPLISGITNADKPMLVVNNFSNTPNWHYLYAAGWNAGTTNPGNLWITRSTNYGVTCDSTKILDTRGQAPDFAILPDGTVFIAYLASASGTNALRCAWQRPGSTNWVGTFRIPAHADQPNLYSVALIGSGTLMRSNNAAASDYFDSNGFPRVTVRTNDGKIYLVYADLPSSNTNADRGDIFLMELTVNANDTLSYAGPMRVNGNTNTTDQWNPSIAISPDGTQLFIGYYSRQNDSSANSLITPYGAKAYITNGFANAKFGNFPVSSSPFPPLFAGSLQVSPPANSWLFDPVWPQDDVCFDQDARYCCAKDQYGLCPQWPGGIDSYPTIQYSHFCGDDYTWSAADAGFFYFGWCDRSDRCVVSGHSRVDANIRLAKIRR